MSPLLDALPALSGFLSVELTGQINSLLKQTYKYVQISTTKHTIESMANEAGKAGKALFDKIRIEQHCSLYT